MSNLTARKVRKTVVSNLEIFALFFLFVLILYVLFPRGSLRQKVLSESTNYNLTAKYLSNFIKIDPQNSDLVLAMALTLHRQYKDDLALNLLNVLKKTTNQNIALKSTLLELKIYQNRLVDKSYADKKDNILQKSRELLNYLLSYDIDNIDDLKTLYYTSLSLHDKKTALKFNMDILKHEDVHRYLFWLKSGHYLATSLGKKDVDKKILSKLVKSDVKNSSFWLALLMKDIGKIKDEALFVNKYKLKKDSLVAFYLLNHDIKKAQRVFRNEDDKEVVLKKLSRVLLQNNRVKTLAKFISKFDNLFVNDKDMVKEVLKIYLAADRTDLAKKFSLKVINESEKK